MQSSAVDNNDDDDDEEENKHFVVLLDHKKNKPLFSISHLFRCCRGIVPTRAQKTWCNENKQQPTNSVAAAVAQLAPPSCP
jgi:hypothetical protein